MLRPVFFLLLLLSLAGCGDRPLPPLTEAPKVQPSLAAHAAIFEKRVEKVTDGVYVAIGYALANSIMLEGDDGIVIVDVTESVETAREVRKAFRAITNKPIRALIYTHNHADHVFGGLGFFAEGELPENGIPVYAHDSTNYYINRFANIIRPAIATRSERMFGSQLPVGEDGLVNCGIGPYLAQVGHSGGTIGLLRPNRTFSDRLDITVAGLHLQLVHAPGETNDQLFVWLPEKGVLLPGDNIYKSFPNLYTIRGTLYRDVLQWVHSLDRIRALKPRFLVPSHTVPVSGESEIQALLTDYRDAIAYVHDQTIRGINQGQGPDELVQLVQLPAQLKAHPWLQEHYGRVSWSVRNVFSGYLGWFGGDSTQLSPLVPADRGREVVTLAGGEPAAMAALEQAVADGRYQWAAELATWLIDAGSGGKRARQIKAQALRQLGYASVNPNGRNYYLTQALELEGKVDIRPPELRADALAFAKTLPIGDVLSSLPVNLDPEKSADVDTRVLFRFSDTGELFSIAVRRGVAELIPAAVPAPDLEVTTTTDVLTEVLLRKRNVAGALASGDLDLGRGVRDVPSLVAFLLLFKA